jgi:hypothetical protein
VWKPDAGFEKLAYLSPMQIRAVVAAVALSAAVLTGCTPEPEPVTTSPAPASTPVFASEAEALAAAEASYAAYQATIDAILATGGEAPEQISAFATGDALNGALASAADFQADGLHSTGAVKFKLEKVQRISPDGSNPVVVVYACLDVSDVDVLDSNGDSAVSSTRPPLQPLVLSFDLVGTENRLLVSKRDGWSGEDLCVE